MGMTALRRPPLSLLFVGLLPAVSACGPAPEGEEADVDSLIIGDVDFEDVTRLDGDGPERARTRAVGYLSLPARGTRCTAFLIAPDVLMTNHHCVPEAASARGASFDPTREAGVPNASRARYACETRLGGDSSLDFALLACEGRPGDAFGVLALDGRAPARGGDIYVVQQNCDYYTSPGCSPDKVLSRGALTEVGYRLSHDADTLGGSSGSPVLSASGHAVIGLHNAGVGNDGHGRGTVNRAVPMSRIVPALRARFPQLQLGGAEPSGDLPGALEPDALEPNDAADRATPLADADDLTVHPGDQDVFELVLTERSAVSIRVGFSHALGDLDAELRQGGLTGPAVANGVSGDDDERLDVSGLEPGVYYLRVYGYGGATNRYSLRATVSADPDRAPAPSPSPVEPPPADGATMEPNEDRASAPVVALPFAMPEGLEIANGADVDYFAFDADGANSVTVTLSFQHAAGDLDLFVEDAAGRIVATSNGVSDTERVNQAFAAGRYFVKVAGWSSNTGAYGLSIE